MATPLPSNHAEIGVAEAVAATRGTLVRGAGDRKARGFTTDSRAVAAGGAFVALRGERSDGHDHLGKAIEAGAGLVVVERGRTPGHSPDGVAAVEVDDTLVAWADLARVHLARWRSRRTDARVVAITGSAGKTTTKEITAALLRAQVEVHATAGNLNNRIGVPAVVLGLEPGHRVAVLEMGMSVPGEIALLGAIAVPDVAIVTNVGLAHAGGVGGSVADVAREKGALFAALGPAGVAVVNADDPQVMAQARDRHRGPAVTFGRAEGAAVRASLDGTRSARRGRGSTCSAGPRRVPSCCRSRARRRPSTSWPPLPLPTPSSVRPSGTAASPQPCAASSRPPDASCPGASRAAFVCSTTATTPTPPAFGPPSTRSES